MNSKPCPGATATLVWATDESFPNTWVYYQAISYVCVFSMIYHIGKQAPRLTAHSLLLLLLLLLRSLLLYQEDPVYHPLGLNTVPYRPTQNITLLTKGQTVKKKLILSFVIGAMESNKLHTQQFSCIIVKPHENTTEIQLDCVVIQQIMSEVWLSNIM